MRKLRRREKWSQGELAEKLAIHRVTLARWESDLVEPLPEAADRLAKLFGADVQAHNPERNAPARTSHGEKPTTQEKLLHRLEQLFDT